MMTDEQFTLEWESEEICQIAKDGDYMGVDEAVILLNDLTYESNCFREVLRDMRYQNLRVVERLFLNKIIGKLEDSGVELMVNKRYTYHLLDGEEFIIDEKTKKEFDLCMPIGEKICNEFNRLNDELEYWKDKALHKVLV